MTTKTAYGIDAAFTHQNLLLRSEKVDTKRSIYYVSVRRIFISMRIKSLLLLALQVNDATRQFLAANLTRYSIINAGVIVLKKVDKCGVCELRLAQDVSQYFHLHEESCSNLHI